MQGNPIHEAITISGKTVRTATVDDIEYCNDICKQIHGHDRSGKIIDNIKQGNAKVVIHSGKITAGYTCGLDFFNHSVGLINDDIKTLIASVATGGGGGGGYYGGPGILFQLKTPTVSLVEANVLN